MVNLNLFCKFGALTQKNTKKGKTGNDVNV